MLARTRRARHEAGEAGRRKCRDAMDMMSREGSRTNDLKALSNAVKENSFDFLMTIYNEYMLGLANSKMF